MKFYRDLFDASLNRVLPENDKRHFFETFWETFIHMSPETCLLYTSPSPLF